MICVICWPLNSFNVDTYNSLTNLLKLLPASSSWAWLRPSTADFSTRTLVQNFSNTVSPNSHLQGRTCAPYWNCTPPTTSTCFSGWFTQSWFLQQRCVPCGREPPGTIYGHHAPAHTYVMGQSCLALVLSVAVHLLWKRTTTALLKMYTLPTMFKTKRYSWFSYNRETDTES